MKKKKKRKKDINKSYKISKLNKKQNEIKTQE